MQKIVGWILGWCATIGMMPLYPGRELAHPHSGGDRSQMLVALVSDRNLAALPAAGNVGFVKL